MKDFGKLNFSTAFRPTSAFPLDARCVFVDLASAEAAAATAEEIGSTNTVYHYGMQLLVSDGEGDKWYVIQRNKTLMAVGSGDTPELPDVTTSDNGKVLGVVNGNWQKITPEFPKELPSVTTSDNGKVLSVVGGKWQSVTPEIPDVQSEIPVFNLAEKCLTAVTLPEGQSVAETDTADIVEALGQGEVKFAVPVSMSGVELTAYMTMQGFTDGTGMYQCTSLVMMDTLLYAMVVVNTGLIAVTIKPFTNFIDDYLRTALEGEY